MTTARLNARSSTHSNAHLTERQLQIQMLRTRAEFERLALRRSACAVLGAVSPDALLSHAGSSLRASGLSWLATGWGFVRRYPLILSAASTLLSGARRGNPYVRVGMGALLVWRLLRRRG
ncbi:hypothetical protein KVP09_08795 [Alcaligenaceae bacterium CGII-47]|nr:hypothetical protein [Alcaligenaceae bacterium CGII-47]